jgi:cyclopropane-fatty-acyl-phospholipid synthase
MPRSLVSLSDAVRALFPGGWRAAILRPLLNTFVQRGTLIVRHSGGPELNFGDCGTPRVAVRLHDPRAILQLVYNPELALGELYMDGRLSIEDGGDIADLLDLVFSNRGRKSLPLALRVVQDLRWGFNQLWSPNSPWRSKRNVAHHYDLSAELYELFLDPDLQYSCAYFSDPSESLEAAQAGKKHHIASKLLLDKPGLSVLDIGSGWGGISLALARDFEANARGITLSEEQLVKARTRAQNAGLSERCQYELSDYRALVGRYDRIVSVGMFEHVGRRNFASYFVKARELLDDEGVMLLHTIGRLDGPGATAAWTDKYIFPGGYIPALSEISRAIERSGLLITDIEVLRLHYAKTLMEWRAKFEANRTEIAKLYDERFCRMWEFYLAGAEMAFRHIGHVVFQIQIAKRIDALPLTRDYMIDIERAIRAAIGTQPPRSEPNESEPSFPRRVA